MILPPLRLYSRSAALVCACAVLVAAGCSGSRSRLKIGQTAEGEVVEAEGLAPNDASDLVATKRASLVDAQRNAVEKAVGVFVSARTLVEKAVAIENNILARTDGYVKKYDVLDERVDDGLYYTRIRALVSLRELEKDLDDLSLLQTPEIERPRVHVAIVEKIGKEKSDDGAAARSLERILAQDGFIVTADERREDADVWIEGSASAFPFQSGGLGGFVSHRARLTAVAREAGTNNKLLTISKEASGLGGSGALAALKSLETVGEVAGQALGEELANLWAENRALVVLVENVHAFDDVERVRKHLVSQPDVADLVLRRFDEGSAQFDVQLNGATAPELASRLSASRTVKLTVAETAPRYLRLKLD